MSILIKGMKMPKNCAECEISQAYDIRSTWCPLTFSTQAELKKQDNCPLIEVPPHGRLIDADALIMSDKPVSRMMMFGGQFVYTQSEIDEAPTIIEAESEE